MAQGKAQISGLAASELEFVGAVRNESGLEARRGSVRAAPHHMRRPRAVLPRDFNRAVLAMRGLAVIYKETSEGRGRNVSVPGMNKARAGIHEKRIIDDD